MLIIILLILIVGSLSLILAVLTFYKKNKEIQALTQDSGGAVGDLPNTINNITLSSTSHIFRGSIIRTVGEVYGEHEVVVSTISGLKGGEYEALEKMAREAELIKGNAIINIRREYVIIRKVTPGASLYRFTATGVAVELE